jgi:hypothetical protein
MSTYPKDAFTLSGGCNCKAIRYKLEFPPESDRPVALPASKSNGQGDIRMPQSAICFCNDCRIANGSLVLFAIMCPPEQANFSLLSKSASDAKRLDIYASEAFANLSDSPVVGETTYLGDSYFGLYQSSEKALRGFCSKCGTPLLYVYTPRPLPPGATSGGVDIYLGTIDREDLEKLGALDRFVNCKLGIDWVKKLFVKDGSGPEGTVWHEGTNMADFI